MSFSTHCSRRQLVAALASLPLLDVLNTSAWGQVAKKEGPPDPEDVTLETKDGAIINATYYPGTLKKKSIPFILVHGFEGQRGDFRALALFLQSQGNAVIVPDLRGHGQSTHYRMPNGDTKEFDLKRFRTSDFEAMMRDIEAAKRFLLEKNNAGELNIDALCVVGADLGALLAMKWAVRDWAAPVLPSFKQGQDVKALILLSPVQTLKGVTMREVMSSPVVRGQLSTLIVAGAKDNKSYNEAKRLYSSLQSFHAKVPSDPEEAKKKQDLYFITPDTSLSGTKLLESGLSTAPAIAAFIQRRLVAHQDEFPWTDRKSPLAN